MNIPLKIHTPELDEADRIAERWCGHTPGYNQWQVLLVFHGGRTRIYQFSSKSYDKIGAIKQGQFWGKWDKAIAFLVRDAAGHVVHEGPVTDALGNALETGWRDAVHKALSGQVSA